MKLIASDFDGTLYRNGEISARDRAAIEAWQAGGNLFGIVTGRGADILDTAHRLGIALDYAIAYNGALVLDRDGGVLYEDVFPRGLAREYFDFAYAGEFRFQERYGADIVPDDTTPEHQIALLLTDDAQAVALTALLNEHFSGRLSSFSNGWWINTVKWGTSKATGIRHFADLRGIADADIFAVGDSFNDLPMLTAFDGYVMASGHPDMRNYVRNVCEDIAHLTELANR